MTVNMPCPICGSDGAKIESDPPSQPAYRCSICGPYRLSERAAQLVYEFAWGYGGLDTGKPNLASNHHLISAVLRDRSETAGGAEVFVADIEELRAAAVPLSGGPLAAVDRILEYVADHAEFVGSPVVLNSYKDFPIAFAQHHGEFENLISQLASPLGYLDVEGSEIITARVSINGWKRLQELRISRRERRQAFVAMSFAPDMAAAYTDGIAPALRVCGYYPVRIDREQHNEKIDDRIIAAIRKSGIVIADVTGHRSGVYFEAGFAMGLGLPVVWTCRTDQIDQAHFDTRQYSHVLWDTPTDLNERLQSRIEATLPTFPAVPETMVR